jgi:hypothetical protein
MINFDTISEDIFFPKLRVTFKNVEHKSDRKGHPDKKTAMYFHQTILLLLEVTRSISRVRKSKKIAEFCRKAEDSYLVGDTPCRMARDEEASLPPGGTR